MSLQIFGTPFKYEISYSYLWSKFLKGFIVYKFLEAFNILKILSDQNRKPSSYIKVYIFLV